MGGEREPLSSELGSFISGVDNPKGVQIQFSEQRPSTPRSLPEGEAWRCCCFQAAILSLPPLRGAALGSEANWLDDLNSKEIERLDVRMGLWVNPTHYFLLVACACCQ